MVKQARQQKLDISAVYPPLAKAMERENILDPKQLPPDYSLEAIIKRAIHADNLIFSADDAGQIIRDVVACILVLNNFSFKVHEAFSNLSLHLLEIR